MRAALPPSRLLLLPALVALSVSGLSGCATKEFVQKEMDAVHKRIAGLEGLVGQADRRIDANVSRIQATEGRLVRAEQDAASLNTRLEATQSDLAAANQNVAGLLMGLNAAGQRIDANGERVQAAEGRIAKVEQDAAALKKRLDETQADLAGTNQNVAGLLVGLNAASQRMDTQAAELATARQHLGAMEPGTQPATQPVAASVTPASPAPAATQPPASTDPGERLARVGVLIDEIHRRINVNTASLQTANLRIGQLESGLAAAGKRGEESEAILDAVRNKTAAAHEQLAAADQRIAANTHALDQMGLHIDAAKTGLKVANTRLDEAEKGLVQMNEHLARNDAADAAISATAKEALERARAAGKLAEGRLLMETVLSESIGFQLERSGLSESARLALLAFADKLKADNQGVYIEIQGHTDDTGPAENNLRLSRQRAEAVRDFLHQESGIPLHRLAVAAYGESRPVADNKTREGRVMNRRVVLVVLK
ncbi:MAG: OmpA family protein [Thiobacillus sp.]|nr:OmpA family protein [Thiobacillus sp.]